MIYNNLDEYIVRKQKTLQVLNNMSGTKSFLAAIWNFRGLLMPSVTHFFDTATDIALVIEWYILKECKKKHEPEYLSLLDMELLFYLSLSVIIYYRISSSLIIYRFSHSKVDFIFQLLFDYYLIKIIYYNLYKYRSFKPQEMINIVRSLEGSTESVFQSILALVFMIQIYQSSQIIDSLALISFAFSLYSVISRYIFVDKHYLDKSAHNSNIKMEDICSWSKLKRGISINWINHCIFRSIDIFTNIIILALFWTQVDIIYLIVLAAILLLFFFLLGRNYASLLQFIKHAVRQPLNQKYAFIAEYRQESNRNLSLLICTVFAHLQALIFIITRLILVTVIAWHTNTSSPLNSEYMTGTWILIIIVGLCSIFNPIFYFVFITKMYKECNRESVTAFSVTSAVANSNQDFLLFTKLLNIDIFVEYDKVKFKNYLPWLNSDFPRHVYNLLAALSIHQTMDWQIYNFLKQWYQEKNVTDNYNYFKNLSFEQYICKQMSNITYKILVTYCRDVTFYQLLMDNGVNFNDYKIVTIPFALGIKALLIDDLCRNCDCIHKKGVNIIPYSKWNGLHYAIRYHKNITIIKWFLDNNIFDINEQTSNHKCTALHIVMIRIKSLKKKKTSLSNTIEARIAQLLIEHNIDQSLKDKWGRTAQSMIGKTVYTALCGQLEY